LQLGIFRLGSSFLEGKTRLFIREQVFQSGNGDLFFWPGDFRAEMPFFPSGTPFPGWKWRSFFLEHGFRPGNDDHLWDGISKVELTTCSSGTAFPAWKRRSFCLERHFHDGNADLFRVRPTFGWLSAPIEIPGVFDHRFLRIMEFRRF
jgi:hypothetical protein